MIPPKNDANSASKGDNKIAMAGVMIKFRARKLGAPINILIGMKLVAA